MQSIPRTVIVLGIVSLLTDLSSEMIYPLLPMFLTVTLGAGAASLGIIEGIAESTASILKVFSGWWTDRAARRLPFVYVGYGLSGTVRPLIGLATGWPFVLAMRFLDRVGKGIRTSPRDALIADVTDASMRGRAYGFHRAMDHAGAVLGPLVAALLMGVFGLSIGTVFLWAIVPSILVIIVMVVGLREPGRAAPAAQPTSLTGWSAFDPNLKRLYAAILLFTLGNSTDAFILLRLADVGIDATWIAVLWSAHHLVKMVSSWFGGSSSDRVGRKPLLLAGWAVYAGIYLGFAVSESAAVSIALFLAYGVYYGLVEPVERAWIVDLAPNNLRGTAIGYYHGAIGLTALPASLLFGILWQAFGPAAAFAAGAGLAAAAAGLLLTIRGRHADPGESET